MNQCWNRRMDESSPSIRGGNNAASLQLIRPTSVKTLYRQAFSGLTALSFIRKLRN
jgi:hypothetical protein